jgi:hypothetical protein
VAAFDDLDDFLETLTGANVESLWWQKHDFIAGTAVTTAVAGQMIDLWRFSGQPGEGVAPGGTVRVCDNTTAGSLQQTDPGGGRTKWLVSGGSSSMLTGCFMLYDRLLDISGFSGTGTSPNTVGGSLPTRYANGVDNQIWAEVYTQVGASTSALVVEYTNETPTGSRNTVSRQFGNTGFREANHIWPLALQAGDLGVTAVANADLTVTTGTAGDWGITVAHPLALIGSGAHVQSRQGLVHWLLAGGAAAIPTDACLALAWIGSTVIPKAYGFIQTVER